MTTPPDDDDGFHPIGDFPCCAPTQEDTHVTTDPHATADLDAVYRRRKAEQTQHAVNTAARAAATGIMVGRDGGEDFTSYATPPPDRGAPVPITYYRDRTIAECDHPTTVTAPLQVWSGGTLVGSTAPVTVCLVCSHLQDPTG